MWRREVWLHSLLISLGLLGLEGCLYEYRCVNGHVRVDGKCVLLDGGVRSDGASSSDAGSDAGDDAQSTSELCDGLDNDSDMEVDEAFDCIAGMEGVACTTSCGSTGSGLCSSSCELPAAISCVAPMETCNYSDDDCDDEVDEDLWSLQATMELSGTSNASLVRIVPSPDGFVVVMLLDGMHAVAQRLALDGTAVGDSVVLETGAVEVDAASTDAGVLVAWTGSAGIEATLVAFDDLSTVVAPVSVAADSSNVANLRVAAAGDDALVMFHRDNVITAISTDASLSGPFEEQELVTLETVGWPRRFDVIAPSGSFDWYLAYVDTPTGFSGEDVFLQRLRPWGSISGGRQNVTFTPSDGDISPALAHHDGTIGLAYATEGAVVVELIAADDLTERTPVVVGGTVPRYFTELFPTIAITHSGGRWIVAHEQGTRDHSAIRIRVIDDSGNLVEGGDDAPLELTEENNNSGVTAAVSSGRPLVGVGGASNTRLVRYGCP